MALFWWTSPEQAPCQAAKPPDIPASACYEIRHRLCQVACPPTYTSKRSKCVDRMNKARSLTQHLAFLAHRIIGMCYSVIDRISIQCQSSIVRSSHTSWRRRTRSELRKNRELERNSYSSTIYNKPDNLMNKRIFCCELAISYALS